MAKIAIALVLLAVVYLAGYIPEHSKATRLEEEREAVQRQASVTRMRELAGVTYIHASQKNYGLAAKTGAEFFGSVQEVIGKTTDPVEKKSLEDLLGAREKITAELAKGDAEVMNDLQPLFLKTQQIAPPAK